MPLDTDACDGGAALGGRSRSGCRSHDTAAGIHELVNQNMAAASRMHAVEQGADLRGITRARVRRRRPGARLRRGRAARVAARRVPGQRQRAVGVRHAGDAGAHRPRPQHGAPAASRSTSTERDALLDELRAEGRRVLVAAGVAPDDDPLPLRRRRPLPRAGQRDHDLGRRGRPSGRRPYDEVVELFEADYRRIYGLTIPDVGVEAVTWRLSAYADGATGRAAGDGRRPARPACSRTRPVRFDRGADAGRHARVPAQRPRPRPADRRPGDRRGTRDDGRHPSRLGGHRRRRRLARRRCDATPMRIAR